MHHLQPSRQWLDLRLERKQFVVGQEFALLQGPQSGGVSDGLRLAVIEQKGPSAALRSVGVSPDEVLSNDFRREIFWVGQCSGVFDCSVCADAVLGGSPPPLRS